MAFSSQTTSTVLTPPRLVNLTPILSPVSPLAGRTNLRCFCPSVARRNYDHIPNQFRGKTTPDRLMDNYRNLPECLYSLPREQSSMFMAKTSSGSNSTSKPKTSAIRFRPGPRRQEIASELFASRIVMLDYDFFTGKAQQIVNQIMFLDSKDSSKPIYLHISSPCDQFEEIPVDLDAYQLADVMGYITAEVHTINLGFAYGPAAMILARGTKGKRLLFPSSSVELVLPLFGSSGPITTTEAWLAVEELEEANDVYLELISDSTGKTKEEIYADIKYGKCFNPQQAIEYGLADKIINSLDELPYNTPIEKKERHILRASRANLSRGLG